MSEVEKNQKWFLKHFELLEKSLNGESKSKVHSIRKDALARFDKVGFPAARDEEWRFTNIAPIRTTEFATAPLRLTKAVTKNDVDALFITEPSSVRLVFVNGRFREEFSHIPARHQEVEIGCLATELRAHNARAEENLARIAPVDTTPFVALNTAFIQDGAFVIVHDGVEMDRPIECLYITEGDGQSFIANPRNLFVFGRDSRATVVEHYASIGASSFLNNVVSEVLVDKGAVIEHNKLERENNAAFHVSMTQVHQSAGSRYANNAFMLGGRIVRNNITVILADGGAEGTLNGLSLAGDEQLVDNHTVIDHTMPNCTSHELYKSILDGKARGVFNGKIFVRQDAQKTDAKQTNKTLLLSDEATINTKPQLEIFADDVKCTHGAAVGQLDEEQIFYLRSRGIGEPMARDLLTLAFASDVVDRVGNNSMREQLRGLIQRRLHESRNSKGSW